MFELTYQTGLYYQGLGEAGIDFYVQKKKEVRIYQKSSLRNTGVNFIEQIG